MPFGPKRLTQEEVHEIRTRYNSDLYTQTQLAKQFGVSQSLVSKIINEQVHKVAGKISGAAVVKVGYKYGN